MSSMNFVKSVFLSLSVLASAANANLIVNGSFEATDPNPSNIAAATNYPTGTSPLPANLAALGSNGHNEEWGVFSTLLGWSTINDAGVEVQYNGTGGRDADEGSLFLELDTHFDMQTNNGSQSNGGITQNITGLIIGELYDFSFAYMGRSATQYSNDFDLILGNDGVSFLNVQRQFFWNTYSSQFTATSTTMNIGFSAQGEADAKGALIDNVSLTQVNVPVPEPSVLALMFIGLLGFSMRKKVVKK